MHHGLVDRVYGFVREDAGRQHDTSLSTLKVRQHSLYVVIDKDILAEKLHLVLEDAE